MAAVITLLWVDQATEKPDADISVLICGDGLEACFGYWDCEDICWRHDSGLECHSVTHWAEPVTPYDI